MPVEDFLNTLQGLSRRFSGRDKTRTNTEDRNLAKATVESWFRSYRGLIVDLFGEIDEVRQIDQELQNVLRLSLSANRCSSYKAPIRRACDVLQNQILVNLKIAEWRRTATSGFIDENRELMGRLRLFGPQFELSYRQILTDLADQSRITHRGTANELRELFREILNKLAPDKEVEKQEWFKAKRASLKDEREKNRSPTRAERVRYIMRDRDSSAAEVTEEAAFQIDERLEKLVTAIYDRANDAAHTSKQREEIGRLLRYFHAVLFELLPLS